MSRLASRLGSSLLAAGLALASMACSDEPRAITVDVTTGQESDTMSASPAVQNVDLIARDATGAEVARSSAAPGGSLALGEVPIDQFLSFEVEGRDADQNVQVRGRSLGLVVGALEADVIPVFAQRVDAWSRPPGALPFGRDAGVAAVVAERHLMLVGGTLLDDAREPEAPAYYDMLAWGGALGVALPLSPRSIVVSSSGAAVLLVSDAAAEWIELSSGVDTPQERPSGLSSFGDVAGGTLVRDGEGTSYLVGAGRAGAPSDRVLIVAPDRTMSVASLTVPRAGAAVTWIEGVGLVVAGGAADAAGIEVIAPGTTTASTRPFPADPTVGAAAVPRAASGTRLLLLGGVTDAGAPAATRSLDLACTGDCQATDLEVDLGPASRDGQAFRVGPDEVLWVGADAQTGEQRSARLDVASLELSPAPFREPRRGGVFVAAPNGSLALVGGTLLDGTPALNVETFFPRN